MDSSQNRDRLIGGDLVETVANLSGLPEEEAMDELRDMIDHSGHNPKDLTLEQLREVMLQYLDQVQDELIAESK
ncbi:MAG: hypothetical protein CL678_10495 [Bdellovibrionaceae bacterium]|nr:hypothetical protein [Pseudobdellovibrionaceae bacterium]|tara:strand:+ start:607 stop:828 length:222 start_codon:yes stop_codon:yes gene_type:complete